MSSWLIGVVGVIYLFTALSFWFQGDKGLTVVFVGYAASNVGFLISAMERA